MTASNLTPREEYLLHLIASWQTDHEESPTRADIAEVMGITPGRATQLVASMEEKGVLARTPHRRHGIDITRDGRRFTGR